MNKQAARFASACSAIAISRFSLPLHPPKLDEVLALLRKKKQYLDHRRIL